jgi:hypothetical protein
MTDELTDQELLASARMSDDMLDTLCDEIDEVCEESDAEFHAYPVDTHRR